MISSPNPTADPEGVGEATNQMLKKIENVRNHRAAVATQTPLNDFGALGRTAGRTVAVAAATGVVAAGMGAATSASAAPTATAPAAAPTTPAAVPAAPSVDIASVYFGSKTLRTGSRGYYVKKLQRQLTRKGAYAYADGYFGSKTRNAVKRYQRAAGLYVDGVAGSKTKAKLNGSSRAKSSSRSSRSGSGIVNTAYRYVGTRYVWGGTSPAGFDCSGLTKYVYAKNGINIARGARAQLFNGKNRSRSSARPGDLVGRYSGSHIGIYLGGNKKIHSSTYGVPTKVAPLSTMDKKFTSYR